MGVSKRFLCTCAKYQNPICWSLYLSNGANSFLVLNQKHSLDTPLMRTYDSEKVSEEAKIRNRYNHVSHPTQDTTRGSDKRQQNTTLKRAKRLAVSQQVTTRLHCTDKKALPTRNINYKNDPQKKHRLATVSKHYFYWRP